MVRQMPVEARASSRRGTWRCQPCDQGPSLTSFHRRAARSRSNSGGRVGVLRRLRREVSHLYVTVLTFLTGGNNQGPCASLQGYRLHNVSRTRERADRTGHRVPVGACSHHTLLSRPLILNPSVQDGQTEALCGSKFSSVFSVRDPSTEERRATLFFAFPHLGVRETGVFCLRFTLSVVGLYVVFIHHTRPTEMESI